MCSLYWATAVKAGYRTETQSGGCLWNIQYRCLFQYSYMSVIIIHWTVNEERKVEKYISEATLIIGLLETYPVLCMTLQLRQWPRYWPISQLNRSWTAHVVSIKVHSWLRQVNLGFSHLQIFIWLYCYRQLTYSCLSHSCFQTGWQSYA